MNLSSFWPLPLSFTKTTSFEWWLAEPDTYKYWGSYNYYVDVHTAGPVCKGKQYGALSLFTFTCLTGPCCLRCFRILDVLFVALEVLSVVQVQFEHSESHVNNRDGIVLYWPYGSLKCHKFIQHHIIVESHTTDNQDHHQSDTMVYYDRIHSPLCVIASVHVH